MTRGCDNSDDVNEAGDYLSGMALGNEIHDFLYPVSSGSGYELVKGAGDASLEGFLNRLLDPDFTRSEWLLSNNFRRIDADDRIWVYFTAPVRQVRAVGVVEDTPHYREDWDKWAIKIIWDKELTDRLQKSPIDGVALGQDVRSAVTTAGKTAQSTIRRWINAHQPAKRREIDKEVKFVRREVTQRMGQRDFRQELRRAYQDTCAITGTQMSHVLQAAHITPVAAGGQHAVSNGLLLRADVHTLFDLGLITIDDERTVRVDSSLQDSEYRKLDGQRLKLPTRREQYPSLSAIRAHRRRAK